MLQSWRCSTARQIQAEAPPRRAHQTAALDNREPRSRQGVPSMSSDSPKSPGCRVPDRRITAHQSSVRVGQVCWARHSRTLSAAVVSNGRTHPTSDDGTDTPLQRVSSRPRRRQPAVARTTRRQHARHQGRGTVATNLRGGSRHPREPGTRPRFEARRAPQRERSSSCSAPIDSRTALRCWRIAAGGGWPPPTSRYQRHQIVGGEAD
jgi:hypothetical protein